MTNMDYVIKQDEKAVKKLLKVYKKKNRLAAKRRNASIRRFLKSRRNKE